MNLKLGQKIVAIDDCHMNTGRKALIIGKEYEITDITKEEFEITSEIGHHTFEISDFTGFFKLPETENKNPHYGGADNPFEAIKIIEHYGWMESFCKANALKYILRAGKKGSEIEDIDKAIDYLQRYRIFLENE